MNNNFYQKISKADYAAIGNCMLNGSVKNDNGLISEIVILAVLTIIWFWNDLVKNNKYDSEVVILTIVIILGYLIYLYV